MIALPYITEAPELFLVHFFGGIALALLFGALVRRPPKKALLLGGILGLFGAMIELIIVAVVWWRGRYAKA